VKQGERGPKWFGHDQCRTPKPWFREVISCSSKGKGGRGSLNLMCGSGI